MAWHWTQRSFFRDYRFRACLPLLPFFRSLIALNCTRRWPSVCNSKVYFFSIRTVFPRISHSPCAWGVSTTFWCFSEISQLCTYYSRLLNNNNQIWPIYSKLIVKKIFCTMFYVDLFVVNDTHPGIRFDKVRILQQREVIVVKSRMC